MAERAQSITGQGRSSLASVSIPPFWKRLYYFEFWPFYWFYVPAYFYWAYLAIKAKHPTYFTVVNPLMNNSGALESSKYNYLKKLPKHWIPKTVQIHKLQTPSMRQNHVQQYDLVFPLIIKPDCGERGKGVHKVESIEELASVLKKAKNDTLLLQSFCDYPYEAGILFYRFPDGKEKGITSITTKAFCTLTGDGIKTFGELISQNERVYHRLKTLKNKFINDWDRILYRGESILIEPIGSHNLGTTFYDATTMNSPALEAQLSKWCDQLPGLYYGRFDVKFKSWEALLEGKDFKIIEINGVNAEPTHIYHPKYKLSKAYKDIFSHMNIIYEISVQNRALGYRPKPLFRFLTELIKTATQSTV